MEFRKAEGKDNFLVKFLAIESGLEIGEVEELWQNHQIFVGEKMGIPVGFVAYSLKEKNLEITCLALKERFRAQGLAKKFLDFIKTQAKEEKIREISVKTSNDNLPALELYQRFGFKISRVEIGKLIEHHGKEILGYK